MSEIAIFFDACKSLVAASASESLCHQYFFHRTKNWFSKYISSNTVFPQIVSALEQFPPLNSSCTIYYIKVKLLKISTYFNLKKKQLSRKLFAEIRYAFSQNLFELESSAYKLFNSQVLYLFLKDHQLNKCTILKYNLYFYFFFY